MSTYLQTGKDPKCQIIGRIKDQQDLTELLTQLFSNE